MPLVLPLVCHWFPEAGDALDFESTRMQPYLHEQAFHFVSRLRQVSLRDCGLVLC